MSDATIARTADARADVEAPDELTRLVSAVERMSEGIGGMLELAVKLAPNPTPEYGWYLHPDERVAVERLRSLYELAKEARVSSITISRDYVEMLILMVDRRVPRR